MLDRLGAREYVASQVLVAFAIVLLAGCHTTVQPAPVQPTETCLAFFAWSTCMSNAEWASWVQGVGTVAAIFATIALVAWEQAASKRKTRAAATVIASGILTTLDEFIACIEGAADFLRQRRRGRETPGVTFATFRERLGRAPFPAREDLIILSETLPVTSTRLIRVTQAVGQLQRMSEALEDGLIGNALRGRNAELQEMLGLAVDARDQLAASRKELDSFCPS